jgi:hypothetical protein
MAPLAMPAPGPLLSRELTLPGFDVAGETAASPVVAEPVLTFCASAIEFVNRTAEINAMMANFMSGSSEKPE